MSFTSINPTTEEIREVFAEWSESKTREVVNQVHAAWFSWRETPYARRAGLMKQMAVILRSNKDRYARLMAEEMGKPVSGGRAEIEKCAWVCEFYAEKAEGMLADEQAESDGSKAYIAFRPLGVILAVMPWNFPFWQVFRFAVPALMAGNVAVLKHSSNVPLCAQAVEQIFREAGFPGEVLRTLMISSGQVNAVIENPHVKAVSLTGSDHAGRQVAAAAGRVLKKAVIELGGSDPFIVLADADLDEAAQAGAKARCYNSGQSCVAAKRFIIHDAVYDAFMGRFKHAMASMIVGDPMLEETQVGPQAREDLLLELQEQVEASVAKGAKLELGGKRLGGKGYFYPPTILTGVKPGMPAYHEELFGPVAAVIRINSEEEAIAVANDSCYGLGGSVWTRDTQKGEQIAARIEAGSISVNGRVKSDPRLPFGGIKGSGYGRELSRFGIREFVNIQTIWVK
jgi:succinate-semialdehyde dehydrogenase / glutarate-semialdehyde dehydrogenase